MIQTEIIIINQDTSWINLGELPDPKSTLEISSPTYYLAMLFAALTIELLT